MKPVAGDRRAIRVVATPKGRQLVQRGRRTRIRSVAGVLEGMDDDTIAEVDRLSARLLSRLTTR